MRQRYDAGGGKQSMTRAGGKRPASPYLEILRLPGALPFSAAGFLARMPMSMFSLGTVLLVAATTGRYGLAGLVAAAGSVGYALGAPQIARLITGSARHACCGRRWRCSAPRPSSS